MRLLVLVEDYPNNEGGVSMSYVHTRNLYYKKYGHLVDVLNFSSRSKYTKDGIDVYSLKDYKETLCEKSYDLLILHAANIKHHLLFLKKYGKCFKKYLFFYHGHEVLKIYKDYSKPFSYIKTNVFKKCVQSLYDGFKFRVWKHFIKQNKNKIHLIFVSKWMKTMFLKNLKIDEKFIDGKYSIIYNCVGQFFEDQTYDIGGNKKYDFITIRNNLDNSKYGVDIVCKIAELMPNQKFCIYGKGKYFDYNNKALNITWMNSTLNHTQIVEVLNSAKIALMPTRTDAQGLMMCEMAAFGIPVVTSNIDICKEVFGDVKNIYFIDNNLPKSLTNLVNTVFDVKKCTKFNKDNTIKKELDIIIALAS